jgi:hypothetical protein
MTLTLSILAAAVEEPPAGVCELVAGCDPVDVLVFFVELHALAARAATPTITVVRNQTERDNGLLLFGGCSESVLLRVWLVAQSEAGRFGARELRRAPSQQASFEHRDESFCAECDERHNEHCR